ncbi:MAG: type II toxin-antitoxin system Phd/YefM family antitoxin [Minisyncoccales bacterium]
MTIVQAKDAKNKFGQLIQNAQKNPITIQKHGKPCVVVMSQEEYERLNALEDEYWIQKAENAKKEGFLSNSESENLIEDLLNA